MRTENQRIKSRRVALPQENIGHTQVVARPVDAMVHAGGTAPDTSMGDLWKTLGNFPALFSQYGQFQEAQRAENKRQGMTDALTEAAYNKPSLFTNIGSGYDEGYYASKDEVQGMAFNEALKNSLKEVDYFSDVDDKAQLAQKINELDKRLYGQYFSQEYMGSRKQLSYEGAARVTQGRVEAFQLVLKRHTDKRIETKVGAAYKTISDVIEGIKTTSLTPEQAKNVILTQIEAAYESVDDDLPRDRFDSIMVERLGRQAGEMAQNGDSNALELVDTMRDLYGDMFIQGENGEATSRYGRELDAIESQVNRNLETYREIQSKNQKALRESKRDEYLAEIYNVDTTDPAAINSLRERIAADGRKGYVADFKSVLESLEKAIDNEGFALNDDGKAFKSAYIRATTGEITLDEVNALSEKLSKTSFLKVLNKYNETKKYLHAQAKADARVKRAGGGGLGSDFRYKRNNYRSMVLKQLNYKDGLGFPDSSSDERQEEGQYQFFELVDEFVEVNGRSPTNDEFHNIAKRAVDHAYTMYPTPDGEPGTVKPANQAQPKAKQPVNGQAVKPQVKPKATPTGDARLDRLRSLQ